MKKILLHIPPHPHWQHFVHYMQYLYWCTDIILNDNNYEYILIEPDNKSNSMYVNMYMKKILEKCPNVMLKNKYQEKDIYKAYKYSYNDNKKGNFILNNKKKSHKYKNWFPNNNSEKMRSLFLKNTNNTIIRIGILNRIYNRVLINWKELYQNIKKYFNIEVNITYFEYKSFDYQIKFFNEHKIIISPHGAQLCSIPFSQDNSLIIECAHDEWHPYEYFPGLSYTSNKYHAMICDDHSVFPEWYSEQYRNKNRGRSLNSKLNIKANIKKIINVISVYLKNNKLDFRECYLI